MKIIELILHTTKQSVEMNSKDAYCVTATAYVSRNLLWHFFSTSGKIVACANLNYVKVIENKIS